MKSNRKTQIIILIILGINFALSTFFINNLRFIAKERDITSNYKDDFDHDFLKISGVSEKIHIDGNSAWAAFKSAGNCTGNGTYSEPYVIEDLVIDGGGSGRCIWIENSDVFFKVENCSVYNSYYGISLQYVKNAHLQNINCSSHTFDGISLFYSNSNTISGNTATDIDGYGILLSHSSDNKISDNILYSSIRLDGVNNNVSGNVMKKCGLQIYSGNTVNYYSQNIDTTNLVNGKPLYYYTNEIDLGSNNFTNAGQVILASCRSSFIEDLNLSCGETGITLINCNNNTIKRNTVNNNRNDGIYIFGGDNNTISENTVYYNNNNGFFLEYCDYNLFLENNVSYNTLHGYSCYRLENSIISGNNINHNKEYGINFIYCINNKITGNSLIENEKCFNEDLLSEGNLYENNECVNRAPTISGYNLLLLLSIISLVTIILSKKLKKT